MNQDAFVQSQIELARLEARVGHMERRQAEIYDDVKAIRAVLDEARGGGKVAVWLVAAGAGSLASLITWLFQHGFGR